MIFQPHPTQRAVCSFLIRSDRPFFCPHVFTENLDNGRKGLRENLLGTGAFAQKLRLAVRFLYHFSFV